MPQSAHISTPREKKPSGFFSGLARLRKADAVARAMGDRGRDYRASRLALWASALVLAGLVVLIALFARHDFKRSLAAAETETRHIVALFERQLSHALGEVMLVTEAVRQDIDLDKVAPVPMPDSVLAGRLEEKYAQLGQLHALVILDHEGGVRHRAGDRPPALEQLRPVIRQMRNSRGRNVAIGPIKRDPASGRWLLVVARRLTTAEGEFAGAIVAYLNLATFRTAERMSSLAQKGGHAFLLSDNRLVADTSSKARAGAGETTPNPFDAGIFRGQANTLEAKGRSAGTAWILSYRRMPHGNLVVAAALPKEKVITAWLNRRVGELAIAGVSCLILFNVMIVALIQARRRKRAEGELELAEIKLTEAIEAQSEGFALYDANGRLTRTNGRMLALLPELRDQLKIGSTYEALIRAGADTGVFVDAVGTEKKWFRKRLALLKKSKAAFVQPLSSGHWLSVAARRTHDGGTVAIVSDITRLKEREIALSEAKEAAEAASHAKTDFLANMSHELRTPLNAIIGFAEVMEQQMYGAHSNEKYVDYSKQILGSGQHLLAIISDILDVSKIESGEFTLQEEEVEVDEIVAGACKMFEGLSEEKKLTLTRQPDRTDFRVLADPRALKQVLINLISNAVKFTEEGGSVTVSTSIENMGELAISIADTGIGVSKEHLEKIFEPFGQVESAFARSHGGTGLGLPLAKGLIEMHRGRITFSSEIGKGSRVTVFLPPNRVLPDEEIEETA